MNLLDLFSGIGGFSLAGHRAGMETVAFSEIEKFPCRVLSERFPGVPNLGDVSAIDGEQVAKDYGPIDVVTFGSPCQDLSVAGKRAGFAGERSGLFHEAIRVIAGTRPALAIWEQVPGVLSSNSGRDFGAALDALADIGAVDIAWRVLDARYFGVPQRRRRVFVVASFRNGISAGEILFEPEGVQRNLEAGREARQGATPILEVGARTNGDGDRDGDGIGAPGDPMYTLQAGKQHGVLPEVAGTLGGGSGARGWSSDTDRMTFVPVSFGWQNSPHQGDEVEENGTAPLRSNTTPAVGCFSAGQSRLAGSLGYAEEISPTLRGASSGTNQVPTLHSDMAVRRLTPTEAERLQGYPDGWTNLKGAADGPRYKALGNSVAVPVVEWILSRIAGMCEIHTVSGHDRRRT